MNNSSVTLKKVIIFTQPVGLNYGGIMQAIALQNVVKKVLGSNYQVTTAIASPLEFSKQQINLVFDGIPTLFTKEGSQYYLLREKISNTRFCNYNCQTAKNTREYIDKYLDYNDFFDGCPVPSKSRIDETDIFIVGSDQVWRKPYNTLSNMFANYAGFVNDQELAQKNIISYAGSFGIDDITQEYSNDEVDLYSMLLRRFDAVSVREKTGVEICDQQFDVVAEQVLDPTLLLDVDEYLSTFSNSTYTPTYFSYVLDDNYSSFFTKFDKISLEEGNSNNILPPVEDWLSGLKNAEQVITDSFHGMVFAILFQTQFVAIVNKTRGATRFTSLLDLLDLQNYAIDISNLNQSEVVEKVMSAVNVPIDWKAVEDKLSSLREKSLNWLKLALQKGQK